ncbi:MAG TPA: hypothetical protein VFG97_06820 [Pedococcus sp.]|nr:hypothetical protein [Pedococcus sp.]
MRPVFRCNHDYVTTTKTTAEAWLAGRLPEDWFTGPVEVRRDRDEIVVVGTLREPQLPDDADEADREAAARGRIRSFREDTRERRIEIARELEHLSGKKVSWGVRVGDTEALFTHLAAPVMTRLRQPERQVLDTLVDAGVARSRSEALAWCVRLVGERSETWLADLRTAVQHVEEVRRKGPAA